MEGGIVLCSSSSGQSVYLYGMIRNLKKRKGGQFGKGYWRDMCSRVETYDNCHRRIL